MVKQVVFLKKRPDMTMEEFMDYYEKQHSRLSEKLDAPPPLPNAQRYVRRYIAPEKNPLTGEGIPPGYDCIMEIWWNSREDFEAAMQGLADPDFLAARLEDERKLFATNSNPVLGLPVTPRRSGLGAALVTHEDLLRRDSPGTRSRKRPGSTYVAASSAISLVS